MQRGGPSTGLPTKTEQADLLQAMFGRNGECPVAIVAPQSPADCFDMAFEAVRIATRFMTPVFLLSDGYLANGAEPWLIPDVDEAAEDRGQAPDRAEQRRLDRHGHENGERAKPASSCRTSATSAWSGRGPIPGTPGLEHRIGGLEKEDVTGNVNYEPANHEHMVRHAGARRSPTSPTTIPELEVDGPARRRPARDRLGRHLRQHRDGGASGRSARG